MGAVDQEPPVLTVVLGGEGTSGRLRRIVRSSVLELGEGLKLGFVVDDVLEEYVDVLCSREWPQGVLNNTISSPHISRTQSDIAAISAFKAAPRFHIAAGEAAFFKRPPYINERTLRVTQFVGLAALSRDSSEAYMYALDIVGRDLADPAELNKLPDETTACPYSFPKEEPKMAPVKSTAPDLSCWFCLANPQVDEHLVLKVFTHSYLALSKGPVVPEHLLVIPILHCNNSLNLPIEVREEIEGVVEALKESMREAMVYELCTAETQHMHINIIPGINELPGITSLKSLCKAAQLHAQELSGADSLETMNIKDHPFMLAQFNSHKFLTYLKKSRTNLGRDMACDILNLPERKDWRSVKNVNEQSIAIELRRKYARFRVKSLGISI
mmetsp:Transcript_1716/g.3664  ORF Transcript_1716/g.3664 Transcript_1716/m.3664 type:complete len:385 (-) Transcript_1716:2-1156(-)